MKRERIHNIQFTLRKSIPNILIVVKKLQSNFIIEKHESKGPLIQCEHTTCVFCYSLQIYIIRNTHKILCTPYHKYVDFEL